MRAVESEGATVEQAIERALILLDLPREGVEVEVVQQAMAGATAIVRVTPRGHSRRDVSRETATSPAGEETGDDRPDVAPTADVRALVTELLGHMGLMCRVAPPSLEEEGGRLRIEVAGEDAALVIGRQGQTLDAIELVINRIVDRQWPGSPQITMDAEGYRDRRARKLIDVAFQEAGKVRRSGRRVDMEPMSPRDRRSVHLALQNEPGVSTHSEGDGPFRHIVIEPTGPVGLSGTRPRFR